MLETLEIFLSPLPHTSHQELPILPLNYLIEIHIPSSIYSLSTLSLSLDPNEMKNITITPTPCSQSIVLTQKEVQITTLF